MDCWVITFRVDAGSGVAPYRQLVAAGPPGPPPRDPARGRPAPHGEGGGRPGRHQPQHRAQGVPPAGARGPDRGSPRALGTFITRSLAERPSPPTRACGRTSSGGSPGPAGRARRREHRRPVRRRPSDPSGTRGSHERAGRRGPRACATGGAGPLRHCDLELPDGAGGRPGRRQRRGEVDAAARWPSGCSRPTEGSICTLGGRPGAGPDRARPASGSSRRTHPSTPGSRWPSTSSWPAAQPALGPGSRRRPDRTGCGLDPLSGRAGCRAASGPSWRSPWPSASGPSCSCSTSRCRAWTPSPAATSSQDLMELVVEHRPACSCPPTSCPTSSGSATTSSCWPTAGCAWTGRSARSSPPIGVLTGPRRDLATLPAEQEVVQAPPHGAPDHGRWCGPPSRSSTPGGRSPSRPGGAGPGLHVLPARRVARRPRGSDGGAAMTWLAWRQGRAPARGGGGRGGRRARPSSPPPGGHVADRRRQRPRLPGLRVASGCSGPASSACRPSSAPSGVRPWSPESWRPAPTAWCGPRA